MQRSTDRWQSVVAGAVLVLCLSVIGWIGVSQFAPTSSSASTDGFDLELWPNHVTVWQTFTVHHVIGLSGKNGINTDVAVSVSGLPSGTVGVDSESEPFYFCPSTCLAKPNSAPGWSVSVKDGEQTTLNPNFGSYGTPVPVGTYTVTVTASADGYTTKSGSFTLRVVDNTTEACEPLVSILVADDRVKRTVTAGETITGTLTYRHEACEVAVGEETTLEYAGSGSFTSNGSASGTPGLDDTMSLTITPTSGSLAEDIAAEGSATYTLTTSTSTPNGTYAVMPASSANSSYYPLSVVGISVTGGTTGSTTSTGSSAASSSSGSTSSSSQSSSGTTATTSETATVSSTTSTGTSSTSTTTSAAQASSTIGTVLSLSKSEAAAGTEVVATGTGFTANEELTLYLDPYVIEGAERSQSGRVELGKATAARTGRATVTFSVPEGITAGSHVLRLTNRKFDSDEKAANSTLTVPTGDGVPTAFDAALTALFGGKLATIADAGDTAQQQTLIAQAYNLTQAATDPNYPKEPIVATPIPTNPMNTTVAKSVSVTLGDTECSVETARASNSIVASFQALRRVSTAFADTCTEAALGAAMRDAQPFTGEAGPLVDEGKAARGTLIDTLKFEARIYATSSTGRDLMVAVQKGLNDQGIADYDVAFANRLEQPDMATPAIETAASTDPAITLIDLAIPDNAAEVHVTYLSPESGLVKRVLKAADGKIQLRLIPYVEYFIEIIGKDGSRQWYVWRYNGLALGAPEVEGGTPYLDQIVSTAQPRDVAQVQKAIANLAAVRAGFTSANAVVNTVADVVQKRLAEAGETRESYVSKKLKDSFPELETCRSAVSPKDGFQPLANMILPSNPYIDNGRVLLCGMSRFTGRFLKASDRPQDTSVYPEVEFIPDPWVWIAESEYRTRYAQALAAGEAEYANAVTAVRTTVLSELAENTKVIVREKPDGGLEVFANENTFATTDVAGGTSGGVVAGGTSGGVVAMTETTYPVVLGATTAARGIVPTVHAEEADADTLRFVSTNFIEVQVEGAAHGVLVTDPTDRAVGYNPVNGGSLTQIADATYLGDRSTKTRMHLPGLTHGEYRVAVYGLEEGAYAGTIRIAAGDRVSEQPISGTVKKDESTSHVFAVALDTEVVSTAELLGAQGLNANRTVWTAGTVVMVVILAGLAYYYIMRKRRRLSRTV